MDPLHRCIALGPLAIYLVMLGIRNLWPRPVVINGLRDALHLGLAIAGLVLVGPCELFLPESTIFRLGGWAWILLASLYLLILLLYVLSQRPRLVVYNTTIDELRPLLTRVAQELDGEFRWAADALWFPNLQVRLHLEEYSMLRNVQLLSTGPTQNYEGWYRLEQSLHRELGHTKATPNPFASTLLAAGTFLLVVLFWSGRDFQTLARNLNDLLRH